MELRRYEPGDCKTLTELFYNTVHTVNARDYTPEQLDVWATGRVDLDAWNASLSEHFTLVAVENGEIVGFGDIDTAGGYLDRLFVHHAHQGEGIAKAICDGLECAADTPEITTDASITARPFFEKRGYRVVREQSVERGGIFLTNYKMKKVR